MRKKVLITSVGCPGAPSIIKMLEPWYDLVGVDCDHEVIGLNPDNWEIVPHASNEDYEPAVLNVIERREIDYVLPLSTQELMKLSRLNEDVLMHQGCKVLISNPFGLSVAIDKGKLYSHFRDRWWVPKFQVFKNPYSMTLAYNEKKIPGPPFFVKPCRGNGSRGLFKVSRDWSPVDWGAKPKPYFDLTFSELIARLSRGFPEDGVLASEFLEGREWSVDCVRYGRKFVAVSRVRDQIRSGICVRGHVEDSPVLRDICKEICETLDLRYNINFQFMEPVAFETRSGFKLIECNPRVSGTIALSCQKFDLVRMAILFAEGYKPGLDQGLVQTGRMIRWYREVFY